MEQARYWMWAKQKHHLSSHFQAPRASKTSYEDSWEEQAFAEDAAGPLGGCIWPPRSYSCSFCRREFRSAQALGGHMNVHRRDRARLKQSPNPQSEIHQHHHHHDAQNHHISPIGQTPFSSMTFPAYPSSVCTFVYNPNNPRLDPLISIPSSPASSSRVSALPAREHHTERVLFPLPSEVDEGRVKSSSISCSQSDQAKVAADRFDMTTDNKSNKEGVRKSRNIDSDCKAKGNCGVQTDMSVSLNLVVKRPHPAAISDGKDEVAGFKKKRITESASVPLFLKSSTVDRYQLVHSDALGLSPATSAIDDSLDLELRLGVLPKALTITT